MMKKRILMLGTGGTIACKHTDEGLILRLRRRNWSDISQM